MPTKPTKFPEWASQDETDPTSGEANVAEPPESRKDSGWSRREIPPRQWFNWLGRLTYEWIEWLDYLAIESGSNSDGEWAKFGDGTMLTRQSKLLGSASSIGMGTFATPYLTPTVGLTFPQAFLSAPKMAFSHTITPLPAKTAATAFIPAYGSIDATSIVDYKGVKMTDDNGTEDVTVHVIAFEEAA